MLEEYFAGSRIKKEAGDVLESNYWFLIHDRSLFFVQKRFGKYEKIASSIFIDNSQISEDTDG